MMPSQVEAEYVKFYLGFLKGITLGEEGETELAAGFANRSAALFELGHFKEALRDTDRVLASTQYPSPLLFKIHRRRGLCFAQLGKKEVFPFFFLKNSSVSFVSTFLFLGFIGCRELLEGGASIMLRI